MPRMLPILFAAALGMVWNCPAQTGWRAVADRLITTPVESYPFNWGEGVQMMGLMRVAALTHEARYLDYVEKWARIYESKDTAVLLNLGPAAASPKRTGYCGHWSPASAILYLYQERPRPEHRKLARDVLDFVRQGAERSAEGGLGHWQGSHQLWVDTLYMACPLLAAFDQPGDAAKQILVQAGHLQDSRTGLFCHMWDWQTSSHSEGF
jgi:unsaturated rhamnogalacturonyl hydrolase